MAGLEGKRCGVGAVASAGLAVALALIGFGAAPGSAEQSGAAERNAAKPPTGDGSGGIRLRRVGGFVNPLYVTTAPGRANRKLLFVVEQEGDVRVVRGGRTLNKPFLELGDQVLAGGERGLLSIAFDPGYAKNRRLYAYFTDPEGDIRVSQYRRSRDSNVRAKSRPRPVIEIPHGDAGNHNGGTVAFGPDGHMYLATGDGGGGCDSFDNAQDQQSLLGKLLRIDPKRGRGYTIPAGNPFSGSAARDEIYANGLRNPFRFSFDAASDAIVIGDVGQGSWEEIDYESLAGARGANFGWNTYEGDHDANCGSDRRTPSPGDHSGPIHEYPHDGSGHSGCAVTGGVVVRDRQLRSLYGRYVYADYCAGDLRSLIPDPGGARDDKSSGIGLANPTSFLSGRRGRLYATSQRGELFRVAAAAQRPSRGERPRRK